MGNGEFKASPRNAEELFMVAMDQELLNRLVVIPKDRASVSSKKKNKSK